MTMKNIALTLFYISSVYAGTYLDKNLERLSDSDIPITLLENETSQLYEVHIKFEIGALSDAVGKEGLTTVLFNQLLSGTSRYSQSEIADSLEFYGTKYTANVTHEYATFSYQGLIKDFNPTTKLICHLFKDSQFPSSELKKQIKRQTDALKNLPTNLGGFASRAARIISLDRSHVVHPTEGYLHSFKNIKSADLKSHLDFFNNKVIKKVYMTGPSELKGIYKILQQDCGWSGAATTVKFDSNKELPKFNDGINTVHLVEVPGANQAQIRLARITRPLKKSDLSSTTFASTFLGGGFTSLLVNELRVKRGLTYSASAVAQSQASYGRAVVATFTRNPEVANLLKLLKDEFLSPNLSINNDLFNRMKSYASGSYLFGLETDSKLLGQVMSMDHMQMGVNEIYSYPDEIKNLSPTMLKSSLGQYFGWNGFTRVVVGDPALKGQLEKAGFKVVRHTAQSLL